MGSYGKPHVGLFPNSVAYGEPIMYLSSRDARKCRSRSAGVNTVEELKVIEIMGDKYSYPTLLGIDWAYKNYVVINLEKESMTFEVDGMKVVQPLDPYLGPRYTKP